MTITHPRIRISTPTAPIGHGRGFYQLEEDTLYVQIGSLVPNRKFFSYLESDQLILEFDKSARLIFIEVTVPRRHWEVEKEPEPPDRVELADIRWLDFRQPLAPAKLITNSERNLLNIRMTKPSSGDRNFYLSENVILQVDQNNCACSIWITAISDDLAGHEIAAFRKRLRPRHSL